MKQQKNAYCGDKKQSAQSLVELAISLMIILLLLLGAVEFSLALFQYVTIRDAAQEGAIYGSINPVELKPDGITKHQDGIKYRAVAAASDVLGNQLTIANVSVFPLPDSPLLCEGLTNGVPNSITVKITFAHPITFPLVGPMIGSNTINLTASVTNTILQPTCAP